MQTIRSDTTSLDTLKKKLEDKQGILVWVEKKDPIPIRFIKEYSGGSVSSWCSCCYDARKKSNSTVVRCVEGMNFIGFQVWSTNYC